MTVDQGVILGYVCPDCQTPEENAEAVINESTLHYEMDDLGRLVASPRI